MSREEAVRKVIEAARVTAYGRGTAKVDVAGWPNFYTVTTVERDSLNALERAVLDFDCADIIAATFNRCGGRCCYLADLARLAKGGAFRRRKS